MGNRNEGFFLLGGDYKVSTADHCWRRKSSRTQQRRRENISDEEKLLIEGGERGRQKKDAGTEKPTPQCELNGSGCCKNECGNFF